MIMSSGRFSGGGGGGGSHRDVVFNAKLVADPKNQQVFAAMMKQVDDYQRKLSNLRVGTAGGGSGRPGAGGRAGGAGRGMEAEVSLDRILREERARDPLFGNSEVNRRFEQQRRQQETERRRRDLESLRNTRRAEADRLRDLRGLKKDTKDTMEGIIGLTRAFVLFGVSSEENLEKAVRALAKFEGAVAGVKGGMKLADGLGGFLGRAAPRMGMAAGAGGMGLGAAGIAAGVGVLGGGFAIADQIRYSRSGQIGAYSQGYANMATSLAGSGFGQAIRPTQGFAGGLANGLSGGLGTLLQSGGFYGASDSQRAFERGSQDQVSGMGWQLKESQQRLAIEQQILSLMDREVAKQKDATAAANNRTQGAAFSFQGLSGMDQRAVTRLRDKFLKDPSKIDSRRLQNLMPFVGQAEQEQIAREMEKRSGGYFAGGGFMREREAKLNASGEGARVAQAADMQREFVVKLQMEDEDRFEVFQLALTNALKVADEAAQKRLQEIADEVMELRRQMQQQTLNRNNATSNSYGFGS